MDGYELLVQLEQLRIDKNAFMGLNHQKQITYMEMNNMLDEAIDIAGRWLIKNKLIDEETDY